jgi:hypothetical protein
MFNVQGKYACLAVLALVAGCPADDEDKGSGIADQAGVDEKKPASELTESEAMDLCKAANAKVSRTLSCTTDAVLQTEDKAKCEMLRDACESHESTDDCATAATGLSDCDGITAGDIADCFDDIVAWMKTLSCAEPGVAADQPACMEELSKTCPTLFGSEMDTHGQSHEPSGGGVDAGTSSGSAGDNGSSGSGSSRVDGGSSSEAADLPQCDGVEPGCVQAYVGFCDCCPGSEGCVDISDPCVVADELQTECDGDASCEPACANWIVGDCVELHASGPDSCMF